MTAEATPRRKRRIAIWSAALVVALTVGGGATWALDRFVFEHVQVTDASEYEAENAAVDGVQSDGSGTVDGDTYTSDTSTITVTQVTEGSGEDTVTYYVADVQVTDATAVRSAFADDSFGENITDTVSSIAEQNDAVFAINGDYYGFRDTGIEIRNGVVYRDEGARDGLAFYTDGHVEVYDETQTTADELVAAGVWNTLSFGPALVEDGQIVDGIDEVEVDTNIGNHSIQGEQPRTLVGVIDDNHYIFVVVDGRDEGYSRGVTMTEAAQIMLDLGCETAYNIDGGGSSTMYFDGEVVNQPSNGGERATSDILYVEE